jgi:hypothetical protein
LLLAILFIKCNFVYEETAPVFKIISKNAKEPPNLNLKPKTTHLKIIADTEGFNKSILTH